jgi:hypothetical protein
VRPIPVGASAACALLLLLICGGDAAAQEAPPAIRTSLVLRPGWHALWREDRDGSTDRVHDLRVRFQARALWDAGADVTVGARAAGRFSTEQDGVHFYLRDHIPATDGLRMGEATLDELFVQWRPSSHVQLRLGRFQTSFELAGVPRKSLDRNDSPNTDVTWTDGIAASTRLVEGWQGELVLQRNGRRGPTNVLRVPLDVTGSGSRVTVFSGVRSTSPLGPLIQREVGLTWIPGSIPGDEDPYITLVGRVAAQFPGAPWGGRLVLGTEGGFAPNTPTRVQLRTGGPEDGVGRGSPAQTGLGHLSPDHAPVLTQGPTVSVSAGLAGVRSVGTAGSRRCCRVRNCRRAWSTPGGSVPIPGDGPRSARDPAGPRRVAA